jgi:S1-C subfamily serine protease
MRKMLIIFICFGALTSATEVVKRPAEKPMVVATKSDGLRLESIDTGGVFEKLGLKQGDVIQTINGKPATPESFSNLSMLMNAAGKIEIEVLRDGTVQKMTYNIK